MRARNIKPSFFKNEFIGELPFEARILFIGLWLMADKDGFIEYRPKRIKAEIFPYDNMDSRKIMKLLDLSCKGNPLDSVLKTWFENGIPRFIEIVNFKKHQSPHKNEKSSEISTLINNQEISCNFTTSHEITPPFVERGMMNDERGMMKEESRKSEFCAKDFFDSFWKKYNKKIDKKKCESKFSKLKEKDVNKILDTLDLYLKANKDVSFRKNPLTYLTGECWNDEIIINDDKNKFTPQQGKSNHNQNVYNELMEEYENGDIDL